MWKNDRSFTDLKNLGNLPVCLSLLRPDQNLFLQICQKNDSGWGPEEDIRQSRMKMGWKKIEYGQMTGMSGNFRIRRRRTGSRLYRKRISAQALPHRPDPQGGMDRLHKSNLFFLPVFLPHLNTVCQYARHVFPSCCRLTFELTGVECIRWNEVLDALKKAQRAGP